MTMVISGFPGVGKSHFFKNVRNKVVFDPDSSLFSWVRPGERHPDFPSNYMQYIKYLMEEADIILVSSHRSVRDALVEAGIRFLLVYPEKGVKSLYLKRYRTRGSDDAFVALLDKQWDVWISELENQEGCTRIEMKGDQYLSEVLPQG
jgi:adenylate kinase family enzyme